MVVARHLVLFFCLLSTNAKAVEEYVPSAFFTNLGFQDGGDEIPPSFSEEDPEDGSFGTGFFLNLGYSFWYGGESSNLFSTDVSLNLLGNFSDPIGVTSLSVSLTQYVNIWTLVRLGIGIDVPAINQITVRDSNDEVSDSSGLDLEKDIRARVDLELDLWDYGVGVRYTNAAFTIEGTESEFDGNNVGVYIKAWLR